MINHAAKDMEYALTWANHTAIVSPFGASLRRYFVTTPTSEWNVIWGYSGGSNKKGGQGDVLIPFPGRIKNGCFSLNGQTYALPQTDKDGPNAIHGFLRAELFTVAIVTDNHIVFTYEMTASAYAEKGFPFSLYIEVGYTMSEAGLTTVYKIKNTGPAAAPAGVGFHPYFCAERGGLADWSVKISARDYLELENYVPTGRICSVEGTKLDFRKGRVVAHERYNDCLAHLERDTAGRSYATVQAKGSKNRIVLTVDASFDYVVVYTGDNVQAPDQRRGFAIEPMTCAPDAFNHEGWGTQILQPAAEMSGSYTIFGELTH